MEPIILPSAKECPFCGSSRIVKGERYFAMCVDCGATGPERTSDATERRFVSDWNSRKQETNIARLLEALQLLYQETRDYIEINNLGDPHHNVSMQKAREALKWKFP